MVIAHLRHDQVPGADNVEMKGKSYYNAGGWLAYIHVDRCEHTLYSFLHSKMRMRLQAHQRARFFVHGRQSCPNIESVQVALFHAKSRLASLALYQQEHPNILLLR